MTEATTEANRLATVFGGSGFLGRYIVRALARKGWRIRVAVRRPDLADFLRPLGGVGQIQPVQANVRFPDSIAAALEGASAAVNATGVRAESGAQTYTAVHVEGAHALARAAKSAGVATYVHVSGIGADPKSSSPYIASKGLGEQATRDTFPDAIVMRPSVVFGPEDQFFNRFAAMAMVSPMLPLIGGGHTRFQPVYVGDVADAVLKCLDDPATAGRLYELGGPKIYTFRELVELLLAEIRRKRLLIDLPFGLAAFQARLMSILPSPPLTPDQVELLKRDNVVTSGAMTLAALDIAPTAVEAIVPTYLDRFRRGGWYDRRA